MVRLTRTCSVLEAELFRNRQKPLSQVVNQYIASEVMKMNNKYSNKLT